jgi:hypothetical protein
MFLRHAHMPQMQRLPSHANPYRFASASAHAGRRGTPDSTCVLFVGALLYRFLQIG